MVDNEHEDESVRIDRVTSQDVARRLGIKSTAAKNLLADLQASGLKKKGNGRGTHYLWSQVVAAYEKWDTRK